MLRGKVELDFVYGCETGESSHAQRAEQVAQELLDWNRSPQAALARVEQGFVDIISHHAKLVAEARAAVDSVVNRLSPAALERQTKRAWWTFPFAARTLWRTFTRRHADVAANLAAHFGPRFRGVAGALDAPRPSGPASDAASTPAEDDAEGVPAGGTHWPFEGEVRWEAQEGLNPSEVV
jgi:hypothetical protein